MRDKKTYILGISAFYHDSSAVLIADGEIIAAAQEERFTRKKHDPSFPENAIEYCVKEAGIDINDITLAAFYDKPFLKFERLLETYLALAPFGIKSFISAMPAWIKKKLFMKEYIKNALGFEGKILFLEHHHSHIASAFYPSPFNNAAILTVDGVGEWTTTRFAVGSGNKVEMLDEIRFPHSIGLLYSAFTYYCGFKVNSGEYKLMGLAPYGEPKYVDVILENLIDLKKDGSFKLNLKYFDYCGGMKMTNRHFSRLFGGAPRKKESEIEQRHMDLAKSIQVVTEMAIMNIAVHVHRQTGAENLCLAGGVALNCVANGRLLKDGPFKNIWIQPASSDAGGALGAAYIAWHEYLGKPRLIENNKDIQKASLLGPCFSDGIIEDYLIKNNVPYEKISSLDVPKVTAKLLNDQKVVGWFQGRMEFGPRALGARSIIADPRSSEMQSVINRKIKFRESFRPFAPSILAEKAEEYFELNPESPYMLLVSALKKEKRLESENTSNLKGLEKLNLKRSEVPAITHVDYSARVQTVKREDNSLYYDMIKAFYDNYGCPLVINTSFNVRGEPIVCTPDDAYKCFMRTNMDYLVIGSFVIDKTKQDTGKVCLEEVNNFALD
ncbi:MAG: carbamoyltransferase [Candidatus Omnitrophota bacterium]